MGYLLVHVTSEAQPTFFDWRYYIVAHQLPNTWNWAQAFLHYKSFGMKHGLATCGRNIEELLSAKIDSDARYDVQVRSQGHGRKNRTLEGHRQPLKFLVTVHIYNLGLVNEILAKVIHFIKKNRTYGFTVYINIPVDENIYHIDKDIMQVNTPDVDYTRNSCTYVTKPLDSELRSLLNKIYAYIYGIMSTVRGNTRIIFSDNVGQDIGGFFFILDQVKHDNIKCDYIVKIHSKSDDCWRHMLFSMLDCNIDPIVRKFDCFYTLPLAYKDITFTTPALSKRLEQKFKEVLDIFRLPFDNDFYYCSGTMFIVSSKILEFFNQFDLLSIIQHLNPGKPPFPSIEHGFELFFGYLFKYLGLKTVTCLA
jgi:hypothetical protein